MSPHLRQRRLWQKRGRNEVKELSPPLFNFNRFIFQDFLGLRRIIRKNSLFSFPFSLSEGKNLEVLR